MDEKRWPGGYFRREKDGRVTYVIERRINKRRFHVSTRCHTYGAAMKQLARFEADPLRYTPEGDEPEAPLRMTAELVEQFHEWQLAEGCTTKHANSVLHRLAAWTEDIGPVDLRNVTLRDHIKPALERRKTQRSHRISSIKAFYAWLRKERHLLTSAQDPTLDLAVPQARPEKYRRRKAVPIKSVQAALSKLTGPYRDVLAVMASTGWHTTELERFIREEESEIVKVRRGGTLAVLVTRHKGGELTRTPVTDSRILEAAKRLRARGKVPKRPNAKVKEACRKARVPEFTLGVMRHSVATWSIEAGAVPAQVAEFLNHKDPRTTKRFYADVAVPTTNVPLPRLRLVGG